MIQAPFDGVAFSEASDGDLRHDPVARSAFAAALDIDGDWAWVRQVHGSSVVRVDQPGVAGEADAVWTSEKGLPVAVFTADCLGVVMLSDGAVGVAHAGWRGTVSGVVGELHAAMTEAGHVPGQVAIGPGIGACCFEVGYEVASLFDRTETTTWGTTSVDLLGSVRSQLGGVEVWSVGACTRHEDGWFSHRKDATPSRMVSLGWRP